MLRLEHLEVGAGCRLTDGRKAIALCDFDDCRRIFSGPVFLLASGASAAGFPLADYAQYPVMAMNGSIVRCIDEGISPLFYLCDDPNFVKGRPELAVLGVRHGRSLALSFEVLKEIHAYDDKALEGKSIYLLERANRQFGQSPRSDRSFAWAARADEDIAVRFSLLRQKSNRIGFSRNLKRGYFVARTIPYAGTQLAYHLGFGQVFIAGMDLNPAVGRFYEGDGKVLPTSLDKHYDEYILPSFQIMAREVCRQGQFEVFNLSANSRLPDAVVSKISLSDIDRIIASRAR